MLAVTSWLMILVMSGSAVAGSPAAGMLTTTGDVLVDGHPVSSSTAVFDGQTIQTKDQAQAVLTGQGSVVTLTPNSSLSIGTRAVDLRSGTTMIWSDKGIAAKADNVIVTAAPGAPVKFLAARAKNQLRVTALVGSVYVSDGQQGTQVAANKSVSVPLGSDPPTISNAVPWWQNDDIGIAITVAAAVAAGITVGVINRETSPAHP